MTFGCCILGLGESARPHEQHRVDCRHDVASQQHVELLRAQPQVGKRPFGLHVTEQEQVDRAPQQAHDRVRAVVPVRGDRHQLVGDCQPLVRVPRREHGVVQQGQALTQHDRIAGVASLVDDRIQGIERAASVVRGFGCEPRPKP